MHSSSRHPKRAPERSYVNYFEVGHNACEFVVDLGQFDVETTQANFSVRIVTGPTYAKLLAKMLLKSVQRFEETYGAIRDADDDLDSFEVIKQSMAGYDGELTSRGRNIS
jgi:Protein of unknown function (DUF3467)